MAGQSGSAKSDRSQRFHATVSTCQCPHAVEFHPAVAACTVKGYSALRFVPRAATSARYRQTPSMPTTWPRMVRACTGRAATAGALPDQACQLRRLRGRGLPARRQRGLPTRESLRDQRCGSRGQPQVAQGVRRGCNASTMSAALGVAMWLFPLGAFTSELGSRSVSCSTRMAPCRVR